MPVCKSHPDDPAPIMHNKMDVPRYTFLYEKCFQVIHPLFKCIGVLLITRLIRISAANMVRNQAMKARGELLDKFAVIKRPGWITVEHDNRLAFAFLHIMVLVPADRFKVAFKGI